MGSHLRRRSTDTLRSAHETSDGGLILGGWSNSGNLGSGKTAAHHGALDYWIVRLDASGNKLWDRSYGGTGWDELYEVIELADGGFLLGGYSSSPPGSGTKTSANYGSYDYWIVRTDQIGREQWQQSYGGPDNDYLLAMVATTNGFLLTGGSASPAGPIKTAPNYGVYDFWAVRIDDFGHKLWDYSFGGDDSDFAWAAITTADGGFLLGGGSRSGVSSTNKSAVNHGGNDFWVVRLNADGTKVWDQSYGGLSEDRLLALAQTPDGGLLLAGESFSSPSGTKRSPNRGELDYWVVRLGLAGQQLWDQSFGGKQSDSAQAIGSTSDGGFFVAGTSWSDVSGNKTTSLIGGHDFWFLKLRPETPGDCDGDGVPDERDLCPATPLNGLVDARGCTLAQSCPCDMPWRNSSEYVNCVRHVTTDFVRAGLLTREQQDLLLTQAKLTNCPPLLPPPDTIVSFGFTNVALGGATLSTGWPEYETSGPGFPNSVVVASELDFDGSRGMAVLLGQADSGIFFYPNAPVPWGSYDESNFLLGKAFGRINGVDNLLLGGMVGRKTYYEYYPVDIDLGPLAPTSLTLQVFLQGNLQSELQVTGATTRIVVHASVAVGPRANPFWRMPDGAVGAVVDLTAFVGTNEWSRVEIELPGVEERVIGDRVFIRANNPAYEVDYVSRFEVYGGGGLSSFSMDDGQIGMFKLPHRIVGNSVFGAADGNLTIQNLTPELPEHGTIVELPETRLFDVSIAPVTLTSNEYFAVHVRTTAEGVGSGGEPYYYEPALTASLEHRGSQVELTVAGPFDGTNVLVKVYKHGTFVGQTVAPVPLVGSFSTRRNGSAVRLAGFSAVVESNAPPSLTLSLDRLYTFTTATGAELRGNLLRLEPQSSATSLLSISGVGLHTTHPSFTIRDEQFVLVPPRLSIGDRATVTTLSWPLQNHPFVLEAASSLDGPFVTVTNEPTVLDGVVLLPLPPEPGATRFFRLRLNE